MIHVTPKKITMFTLLSLTNIFHTSYTMQQTTPEYNSLHTSLMQSRYDFDLDYTKRMSASGHEQEMTSLASSTYQPPSLPLREEDSDPILGVSINTLAQQITDDDDEFKATILPYVHTLVHNATKKHQQAVDQLRTLHQVSIENTAASLEFKINATNNAVIELQKRRRRAGLYACLASSGAQLITTGVGMAISGPSWLACDVICPISTGIPLTALSLFCYYKQQKKIDATIEKLAQPNTQDPTPNSISMEL